MSKSKKEEELKAEFDLGIREGREQVAREILEALGLEWLGNYKVAYDLVAMEMKKKNPEQ